MSPRAGASRYGRANDRRFSGGHRWVWALSPRYSQRMRITSYEGQPARTRPAIAVTSKSREWFNLKQPAFGFPVRAIFSCTDFMRLRMAGLCWRVCPASWSRACSTAGALFRVGRVPSVAWACARSLTAMQETACTSSVRARQPHGRQAEHSISDSAVRALSSQRGAAPGLPHVAL
jgi:hypothetical protein